MSIISSWWSTVLSAPLVSVLLAVLVLVILTLVILTIVVIQLETRLRYLATPVFDQIVQEARQKAESMLSEAEEQSRSIRATAQIETEKIFASRKDEDEKFRLAEVKCIEEITAYTKELLGKQADIIPQLSESMAKTFAGIGAKAEQEYQTVTADMKKRLNDEVAKEVAAARQAVATYRQERFAMLDQEIVMLVEDTARIVLSKSLSLGDHRGIILNALAEAKQQGVFGPPA